MFVVISEETFSLIQYCYKFHQNIWRVKLFATSVGDIFHNDSVISTILVKIDDISAIC